MRSKLLQRDAVSALTSPPPPKKTLKLLTLFLALPKRYSHLTSAAHGNAKVRLIRKASALVIASGSNCHRFSVIIDM